MSDEIVYGSSKTYTHNAGFSCCFRQWRATSHCNQLHGYAIQVALEFEASRKDERNWVMDFGGLKEIKEWLEYMFDHTLLIARDDPKAQDLENLRASGLATTRLVDNVGCEAFSELIFQYVNKWLDDNDYKPRVSLTKVTVSEHPGNSAWVRAL